MRNDYVFVKRNINDLRNKCNQQAFLLYYCVLYHSAGVKKTVKLDVQKCNRELILNIKLILPHAKHFLPTNHCVILPG